MLYKLVTPPREIKILLIDSQEVSAVFAGLNRSAIFWGEIDKELLLFGILFVACDFLTTINPHIIYIGLLCLFFSKKETVILIFIS